MKLTTVALRYQIVLTFIFNKFINLEPVQRYEDSCEMRRFRSFDHSMCKIVQNLLEGGGAFVRCSYR